MEKRGRRTIGKICFAISTAAAAATAAVEVDMTETTIKKKSRNFWQYREKCFSRYHITSQNSIQGFIMAALVVCLTYICIYLINNCLCCSLSTL